MNDIEARITQLEHNMNTLLSVRRAEDERNASNINDNNIELAKTRGDLNTSNESLEETAITVADFLAEYYLSQLGIDDFEMEGGEEE